MSNRFFFPDDDDDDLSAPATPQSKFGDSTSSGLRGGNMFQLNGGRPPSTTPAGRPPPPPSSAGSFTPAGAPSASYMGSSMMRSVADTVQSSSGSRNLFSGHQSSTSGGFNSARSPLGRSVLGGGRGSTMGRSFGTRKPSRLSQVLADDEEEEEEEEEEEGDEEEEEEEEGDEDEEEEGDEDEEEEEEDDEEEEEEDEEEEEEEDEEEDEDASGESDYEHEKMQSSDPWLDLAASPTKTGRTPLGRRVQWTSTLTGGSGGVGDESDLMMFATPAVNDRIRKEAEDIYRASVARSGGQRPTNECRYAPIAKSMYTQMGYAKLVEAPQLVRHTEAQISRLYSEGVGPEDDAARLERALAETSAQLVGLWQAYADSLPRPLTDGPSDKEQAAGSMGPGPQASAFANAAYVATLALQVHHTRSAGGAGGVLLEAEPLPETLFRWMAEYHNLYPEQVGEVLRCQPGAASHGLFWQTVFTSLLQGRVDEAIALLRAGGWESVRRAGVPAYTGRALANVQRAVHETISMLETCPGRQHHWDVWSSEWTLFRIRAKGILDQLRRFAEGRSREGEDDEEDDEEDDDLEDAEGDEDGSFAGSLQHSFRSNTSNSRRGRRSMAGLARKAESQVPWDIYESLNIVFDVALGSRERILSVSQDWCEAALGLFGWWDETRVTAAEQRQQQQQLGLGGFSKRSLFGASDMRASLLPGGPLAASASSASEGYQDRLARAFRATGDAGHEINANRPLEVALACVLEDNTRGLVGLLRGWSLPVAAAVAEIASLGGWLTPPAGTAATKSGTANRMGDLDMEDLEVLGVDPQDPDELDGFKDNTLVQYAQALVNDEELMGVDEENEDEEELEGWELAIRVLGRMHSPERSEDTVGELVRTMLKRLDVASGRTVDKIWQLLVELGMGQYAEEVAEHYGDLLANESRCYGEAIWYYAVAHRPAKVREVLNLLMSYSLMQSAAFPAEDDLDDRLRHLLVHRRVTLEQLARRDLEAGELLGRLLSGYATLRRFYELRDDDEDEAEEADVTKTHRYAAAAAALTAVIASADDNIRGGLYDASRDAVVSEDVLLALLGEALVFAEAAGRATAPPLLAAETVDVLLKAVEDLQTLAGSRVFAACDDFFQVVLASVPGGLRGSTPADLLRKSSGAAASTQNLSSSYVLAGSSVLASQLHRSLGPGAATRAVAHRGWDWRSGLAANTTAHDVLQRVRLGLSRSLARLWVAETDGAALPALAAVS